MIDFSAFLVAVSLSLLGALLGELIRLVFGFHTWLQQSFGRASEFCVIVVVMNTAVLAARGGVVHGAPSLDWGTVALAPILYAALWLLVVNAVGVIFRATTPRQ